MKGWLRPPPTPLNYSPPTSHPLTPLLPHPRIRKDYDRIREEETRRRCGGIDCASSSEDSSGGDNNSSLTRPKEQDDDEDEEEKKEEDEPLNSGDDMTGKDAEELFQWENLLIYYYDCMSRDRSKWHFCDGNQGSRSCFPEEDCRNELVD
ncbi:hypothetical protein ACTXT7_002476 [Hymenolepis weldensis]